jgi:hypothetical protein
MSTRLYHRESGPANRQRAQAESDPVPPAGTERTLMYPKHPWIVRAGTAAAGRERRDALACESEYNGSCAGDALILSSNQTEE